MVRAGIAGLIIGIAVYRLRGPMRKATAPSARRRSLARVGSGSCCGTVHTGEILAEELRDGLANPP